MSVTRAHAQIVPWPQANTFESRHWHVLGWVTRKPRCTEARSYRLKRCHERDRQPALARGARGRRASWRIVRRIGACDKISRGFSDALVCNSLHAV